MWTGWSEWEGEIEHTGYLEAPPTLGVLDKKISLIVLAF